MPGDRGFVSGFNGCGGRTDRGAEAEAFSLAGSWGAKNLGPSVREVRESGCQTGGWASATKSRSLFFPAVDCDAAAKEAGGWSLNLSVLISGK